MFREQLHREETERKVTQFVLTGVFFHLVPDQRRYRVWYMLDIQFNSAI